MRSDLSPAFFYEFKMIRLLPNTADQDSFLTLKEFRRHLPSFDQYLLEISNAMSNESRYMILNIITENERYTQARISTDANDAENGSLLIEEQGQYRYTVYGQNSSTNLDPNDAAVVGIVEKGVILVMGTDSRYDPDIREVPAFKTHT